MRGIGLIARTQNGAREYYHHNVHGDVIALTDRYGTVKHDYRYDAFGNELEEAAVQAAAGAQPAQAAPLSDPDPAAEAAGIETRALQVNVIEADTSADIVYVSDMDWTHEENRWMTAERDRSNDTYEGEEGGTLQIGGYQYEKGIGCHAYSEIEIELDGLYSRFNSDVGIDERVPKEEGSVQFEVYGDGEQLEYSGVMRGDDVKEGLSVDVSGVQTLRLVVEPFGDDYNDFAVWGDAKLTRGAPATPKPTATPTPEPTPVPGQSSVTMENPFRYGGEYADSETGSIYLRARYYDPNSGRFISEDPIKDGYNWYVYAGNNPVKC